MLELRRKSITCETMGKPLYWYCPNKAIPDDISNTGEKEGGVKAGNVECGGKSGGEGSEEMKGDE